MGLSVVRRVATRGAKKAGFQSHSLILQSKDGGILIPKQNSAWQQEQHCSFHSALGISYPYLKIKHGTVLIFPRRELVLGLIPIPLSPSLHIQT